MTELRRAGGVQGSLKRAAGVYALKCLPTGRVYIGETSDLLRRKKEWRYRIVHCECPEKMFEDAVRYGVQQFIFMPLKLIPQSTQEERLRVESAIIQRYWERDPNSIYNCLDREYGAVLTNGAASPREAGSIPKKNLQKAELLQSKIDELKAQSAALQAELGKVTGIDYAYLDFLNEAIAVCEE